MWVCNSSTFNVLSRYFGSQKFGKQVVSAFQRSYGANDFIKRGSLKQPSGPLFYNPSRYNCEILSFKVLKRYCIVTDLDKKDSEKENGAFSNLKNPKTKKIPAHVQRANHTYSVIKLKKDGAIVYDNIKIANLITRGAIHARDVMSLGLDDTANTSPAILPRGDSIVIALARHVKCVLHKDEVTIFGANFANVRMVAEDLSEVIRNTDWQNIEETFELVLLEELLRDVCSTWNRRVSLYRPVVESILSGIRNELSDESGVYKLVPLKDSLQSFDLHVNNVIHCISDLLENEEDLIGLLLTERAIAEQESRKIAFDRHHVVEVLLENYLRQLIFIRQEITYFLKKVQNKQELAAISMDSYRNRMIRMNVQIAIGSLCLSVCTTIAGFFGMNLINGLEESSTAFVSTVMATSALGTILYAGCYSYLSSNRMRQRAKNQMEEIQAISGVLNNMNSLDYAVKYILEKHHPRFEALNPGVSAESHGFSRADFSRLLEIARPHGSRVTSSELDLIFEILDKSGDGVFQYSEFQFHDFKRINDDKKQPSSFSSNTPIF